MEFVAVTPLSVYETVIKSERVELHLETAADGTFRGARHGVFTHAVQRAMAYVETLEVGHYTVKQVAADMPDSVPGWAVRVAVRKLASADESTDGRTYVLHSGGRGNPSQFTIAE